MTDQISGNVQARIKERVQQQSGVEESFKLSVSIVGGVSAVAGLWAAVALISAMIEAGGLFELASHWFGAAFGTM